MTKREQLYLYEEIMLLALRDEKGTLAIGFVEQLVAGAVLAELLLEARISVEDSEKQLVSLDDSQPFGDPIIDECLETMAVGKQCASLKTWVSRLARIKNLKHNVARQLCHRKILRADEDKVLFVFNRRVYPEIDPVPEQQIIERLKAAIFTDREPLDPRTVVLISLANGSELLRQTFGRKELKPRQQRIEQIVHGELTGNATKEVIEACQTAAMVAAIMPAVIVTTVNS